MNGHDFPIKYGNGEIDILSVQMVDMHHLEATDLSHIPIFDGLPELPLYAKSRHATDAEEDFFISRGIDFDLTEDYGELFRIEMAYKEDDVPGYRCFNYTLIDPFEIKTAIGIPGGGDDLLSIRLVATMDAIKKTIEKEKVA